MTVAHAGSLAATARIATLRTLASVFIFGTIILLLPFRSHARSPLDTLQAQHPRLFIHDSDLPAIKHAIATDPFVEEQYRQLLAAGEELLTTPPAIYKVGSDGNLLSTAHEVEGRIFTLAGLYRINGDHRFAARATQEMLAAAAFPDWHPHHFLETAEMTAALGLGYDWLYATFSPADRTTIKNAIVVQGIDPWLDRMHGRAIPRNNWVQVCNGGETVGALAVADEEPIRARAVLDYAHTAMTDIMQLFAPDGGFEEGPVYWFYATIYNVLYIGALDSALGTDFGASDSKGFSTTADYRIQSIGPSNQFANFSDARPATFPNPQMFWFARRFQHPAYAAFERNYERNFALSRKLAEPAQRESSPISGESGRFAILGLFWSVMAPSGGNAEPLPLVQSFSRTGQAYVRSVWNDPNAWYVGFKCGDAKAHHGHLDLGSFVMDALGQRWASDLGGDSYSLPGYFDFASQRWTYYRMRTEGHNTLTIDAQNEDLDAKASITATGSKEKSMFAIADLSQVYKGKLQSWNRGVALLDKERVLVQDEVTPTQPVNVVWSFHTFATVQIAADGHSATLTLNGATLHAQILAPAQAHFETASAQVLPPQASNQGVTNLVFRLPKQTTAETIAVLFSQSGDRVSPRIEPLSKWR